jgi:hypothetical protein
VRAPCCRLLGAGKLLLGAFCGTTLILDLRFAPV